MSNLAEKMSRTLTLQKKVVSHLRFGIWITVYFDQDQNLVCMFEISKWDALDLKKVRKHWKLTSKVVSLLPKR